MSQQGIWLGPVFSIGALVERERTAGTAARYEFEDPVPYAKERLAAFLRRELALINLHVVAAGSDGDTVALFKQKYPSAILILISTDKYGIDDNRAKYSADLKVIRLADDEVLMSTRCYPVAIGMLDATKPPGTFEEARDVVFGNDGALIKENLRRAAEVCAGQIGPRFLGRGPRP